MAWLRVALLQLLAHGTDQDANARKGEAACRTARDMGADIALFPEMWNIGYTPFSPAEDEKDLWRSPALWSSSGPIEDQGEIDAARHVWQSHAIDLGSPFVRRFQELAAELEMAIGLTFLERWPGKPRNTMCLIDRRGGIVLRYAKVHTCCFGLMEDALTPGDAFPVCRLDTAAGDVSVGAMICFDREFPESARILMLNGAEVILIPNACPMEMHRIGQLRSRAWENLTAVALANYAAPQQNGHSVAFDPIVFRDDGASRDNLVIEAGEVEGIYLAPFDLDALREFRQREALGNAFRRVDTYDVLIDPSIAPPYQRVNGNGVAWRPGAPADGASAARSG